MGNYLSAWGTVAADIDADAELEIIMNSGHKMYVINPDGSHATGWPITIDQHMQYSPAVGDIDGDGSLEILASARSNSVRGTPSYLYAWHSDGSIVEGFPVSYGGFFGNTPVLYDFDDDGDLEIVIDFGKKFYLLDHSGAILPGWPQSTKNGEEITSKPSIGDIDGDGVAEIVTASHFLNSRNKAESGHLYAFEFTGELIEGWPIKADSGFGFHHSDPVLADFDSDGSAEIVVNMVKIVNNFAGKIYIFYGNGTVYPGWPQRIDMVNFGVSVGDIDQDLILDIVAGSYLFAYLWSKNGSLHSGWPIKVDSWSQPAAAIGNIKQSDGLEILIGAGIVRDQKGYLYSFQKNGDASWPPLRPRQFVRDTPLLTDLERNGSVDIIVFTSDATASESWIYAWEIPGMPYTEIDFPWPMYGHDRYHTSQHGFTINN